MLSVHHALIDTLPIMRDSDLRTFLVLLDREQVQSERQLGLSLAELATTADVSVRAARDSVSWLTEHGYIQQKKKTKHWIITIGEFHLGRKSAEIPFTYDDTSATKIAKLEQEVRVLAARRKTPKDRSGLADIFTGEKRDLIVEIEARTGRAIEAHEAMLLGECIAAYGIERTKQTWRQQQGARDPIRYTYALLYKGVKGKGAPTKESQPYQTIKYRELNNDND